MNPSWKTALRDAGERLCRPVSEWPSIDQAAWAASLRPGDAFVPGGLAGRWSAATRLMAASGYGRWLTWLDKQGILDQGAAPENRITRERAAEYVAELQSINAPYTVQSRVQQLGDALRAMSPNHDWGWIMRAANRLRGQATSIRNKRSRLQSPARIATLGMRLMAEVDAAEDGLPLDRAQRYRDGLIVAFLAHRPIRGKNLAAMSLGRQLVCRNGIWWVVFDASETKARRSLEVSFPADLVPHLQCYLGIYRPILLARAGRETLAPTAALWVSRIGTAMVYASLVYAIERRTREAFGAAINPHLFRDCVATSIAIDDPEHVRIITAILGHSSLAISERHYNQARGLESGRRYYGTVEAHRGHATPQRKRSRRTSLPARLPLI